ncbi:MAG: protein translocase subunit SecD [Planctomycetes bacterium]|nr:protein translocase subunit SecD [Planctomycetota bacterium]
MLENARSQLFLCLLSIVGAIACFLTLKPAFGPDLKGGTQLIYEVPEDVIAKLAEKDKDITVSEVMKQTITVISDRIDPNGSSEIPVTQSGDTGILIELPYYEDKQDLELRKSRIGNLGRLEMRMVADGDYAAPGETPTSREITFDMAQEKKRLEDWLKLPGNMDLFAGEVDDLADNIRLFNDDNMQGPVAFGNLAWYVRLVRPSDKDNTRWDFSFTDQPLLSGSTVKAYDDAAWNNGSIPAAMMEKEEAKRFLVELVAINMHEIGFTGEDLDPSGVGPTTGRDGGLAVGYSVQGAKKLAYAEWSEKYLNKCSAIILNGIIKSAPRFESRIPGVGQITGNFTKVEVEELVKVLRTGSLRIEPEFVSENTIGSTLGAEAVERGLFSLLLGGILVFAFMLYYYGAAGMIACITLLMNMMLLWAAMLFMQATITLPGLGGIVLTLGMAVDANVLIYERVREELTKGKDLLRAVRAGFEKAMSAILDSNITTFLVGIVLFNVGVGPVRGFAVTLMAGILMTVFTQFFVTRVLFHYALEKKLLDKWKPRTALSGTNLNFVGQIKKCLTVSIVVILAGLTFAFGFVPREVMLSIDFTGGANLQMVVAEAKTADEIRTLIQQDATFNAEYPNVRVNTVGKADESGRTNSFNLRLKLHDHQRAAISEGRKAWREARQAAEAADQPPPPAYEPPYQVELKRLFADHLVASAFSDPKTDAAPNSNMLFAQIELHFQAPVTVADARQQLVEHKFLEGMADAIPDRTATTSKDLLLQWKVPNHTRSWELFQLARGALKDLKTTDGKTVILSDPFPEAQEIQGRLVDDLRNAAIGALILSWLLVIFYLRIRFHEYKFGFAAVVALIHDVLVTFGVVVAANYFGLVNAEISINMIAAFLTIIGYSVNDTIVVFDRIRENVQDNTRAGVTEPMRDVINRSLNQTLSRTLITTFLTLFVVLAQFGINCTIESDLTSFAFAMIVGMICGTYSTIYIAAPILISMRHEDIHVKPLEEDEGAEEGAAAEVPAQ